MLDDAWQAVSLGRPERLEPLFTASPVVFGLGPSDVYVERPALLAHVREVLMPLSLGGGELEVSGSRAEVGVAPGGASAWFYDVPKVTVTLRGRESVWLPRITGLAVKEGEQWRIDALHVSLAVPDNLLSAPDVERLLLPPAPVPSERGADADEVLGLTRRLVSDMAVKVERATGQPGFVVIGSSAVEVLEGGEAFKALVRPQLATIKKSFQASLDGPLRVRRSPDGRTGWAAGTVVLRVGAGKKAQTLPPFRALWLFVEEGGLWNLASEHESLAVKEDLRESADAAQLEAWDGLRAVALKRGGASKRPAPASAADAGVPATSGDMEPF